jgi:2,4-dienoyl-CoA reductase-like NADH-dependent reductase (Old Yellow Enzyme family)
MSSGRQSLNSNILFAHYVMKREQLFRIAAPTPTGGSLANRVRFLLQVTEAVTGVWGEDRVGVRISPLGAFNDMHDSDPETTFDYAAGQLNRFGLAYLHVVEGERGQSVGHRGDGSHVRLRTTAPELLGPIHGQLRLHL